MVKGNDRGDSALTKWFYGFNSRSSLTKDVKNGSGPCLYGTQDEVGTTKHKGLVTNYGEGEATKQEGGGT